METIREPISLSGEAMLTIVKKSLDLSAPMVLERVVDALFGCKFDSITSPLLKFNKTKSIYSEFTITPTPLFVKAMALVISSEHPESEPLEDEYQEVSDDEEDED